MFICCYCITARNWAGQQPEIGQGNISPLIKKPLEVQTTKKTTALLVYRVVLAAAAAAVLLHIVFTLLKTN